MEQARILSSGQFDGRYLTADFVVQRLAALTIADPGSDFDLNPGTPRPSPASLTPAGVLVPLVVHPDGITVLLTQRTDHLTHHPGQISFPGGRQDPGDQDSRDAALRETTEEIGLARDQIGIIGRLADYVTATGYHVTPWVGLLTPPLVLTPDPFEVAEIFEVPLEFIVNPANHERRSQPFKGVTRHYYVLPFEQRFIWGATAAMLVGLARHLAPP